jgi:16S rRNA (guanine527-N7)-methyltransferase
LRPELRPRHEAPPPVEAGAIRSGSAELGVPLEPAQAEQFARFAALLLRWNAVYNLTAIRDPQRLLTHHLLDCLAILPALAPYAAATPAARILDVGSGGGLPAIPLAVARPNWRVTALDAVEKKCAFLRHARAELHLTNLEVVHARVEAWHPAPGEPAFDLITSRAFASLADFVASSRHLLAPGGHWAALKGVEPDAEVRALPSDVRLAATVKLRVPLLDEQRHLLLITPVGPVSPPLSSPPPS